MNRLPWQRQRLQLTLWSYGERGASEEQRVEGNMVRDRNLAGEKRGKGMGLGMHSETALPVVGKKSWDTPTFSN